MPAGLDGNPHPIRSAERDVVLSVVADRVCRQSGNRVLVGIDGRPGSGKSTFGDELARELGTRGVNAFRSTIDSFHRPRGERMLRGATSADGYYLDSHQIDRVVDELLIPFQRGIGEVLIAAFDEPTDTAAETMATVGSDAVLVFDGLFLHRPEFSDRWDVSVYLDADQRRDAEWLQFLLQDLPVGATERAGEIDRRLGRARWPRYRHGWTTYVDNIAPRQRSSLVIDNNDLARPRLLTES